MSRVTNLAVTIFDQINIFDSVVIIEFLQKGSSTYTSSSVIYMVLGGSGYHCSKSWFG
ncbi:MAG: hypothetical protein QS748_03590 [Candidatus Endonucleobacter bathymodioli]|uniref:Uncharacterized protein n=1 Tax=Candidatus Endonucleibacter bathymodioli TaxID=539814 RepID=A0AA90SS71_9GAMM|nr:hypothetical protein [Candidatus Endonucleobacter bathymodioli]